MSPSSTKSERRAQPAAASQTDEDPDSLTIEMELLGAARTALKAGDINAAMAKLDEHGRRFPGGALASERELSRVTTLCKGGELDAAEDVARRFIAAHPDSAQGKRLQSTCIGARL